MPSPYLPVSLASCREPPRLAGAVSFVPALLVPLLAGLLGRPADATVQCGGHTAVDCGACPGKGGRGWCNGECTWDDMRGVCVSKVGDGDFYQVLEVNDDVDIEEIKRSYRRLSAVYHPDKSPANEERFGAIRDAFEVLASPETRLLYDTGGMPAVRSGRKKGKVKQGKDESFELNISLSEAYLGARRILRISRRVVCRGCRQTRDPVKCSRCNACPGTLQTVMQRQGNTVSHVEKLIESSEDCRTDNSTLEVVVDPGAADGDRITFNHMGSQVPGEIPGHMVVTLHLQKEHRSNVQSFLRQGDDLKLPLELTVREALLGFSRTIRHLDNHTIEVSTESVTRPWQVIRVEGEGMPLKDVHSQFGDLVLIVLVRFPPLLTPDERQELSAVRFLQGLTSTAGQRHTDEL